MTWHLLGRVLGSRQQAHRAAHDFAEVVGAIVNATVSQAPISLVDVSGGDEFRCFVAHAPRRFPEALPLLDGSFLYLYQSLALRRQGRFLATLEYKYSFQATADENSWIVRWEYLREPPEGYPYPRAHLHVNALPGPYTGAKPFADLHLPGGKRVTVEDVLRHLVVEHGIGPISPTWEETVADAEAKFDAIQRRRLTT